MRCNRMSIERIRNVRFSTDKDTDLGQRNKGTRVLFVFANVQGLSKTRSLHGQEGIIKINGKFKEQLSRGTCRYSLISVNSLKLVMKRSPEINWNFRLSPLDLSS